MFWNEVFRVMTFVLVLSLSLAGAKSFAGFLYETSKEHRDKRRVALWILLFVGCCVTSIAEALLSFAGEVDCNFTQLFVLGTTNMIFTLFCGTLMFGHMTKKWMEY